MPSVRELAPRPGHPSEAKVECGQGRVERFGDSDVPGVVGGDGGAERSHARGQRLVVEPFDPQVEQVAVRERGHVVGDLAGVNGRRRMLATSAGIRWGAASGSLPSRPSARIPSGPLSTRAATTIEASTTTVMGCGRSVPGPQRRSWSRWARIRPAARVEPVRRLRSRIRAAWPQRDSRRRARLRRRRGAGRSRGRRGRRR